MTSQTTRGSSRTRRGCAASTVWPSTNTSVFVNRGPLFPSTRQLAPALILVEGLGPVKLGWPGRSGWTSERALLFLRRRPHDKAAERVGIPGVAGLRLWTCGQVRQVEDLRPVELREEHERADRQDLDRDCPDA